MASNDPLAQLRRLLECPVCMEQSSGQRVLPCLHSFCEDCLNSHMTRMGKSGEFPCPLCKKQFPVPSQGATGFQHNFFHARICDVVSNDDSTNKMHCSIHEGRILEFYCEQCKVPTCSRCITSNHNQHKLKDLDVAAKDAIEVHVMRDLLRDVTKHWEVLRHKRQRVVESYIQQQKACKNKIKRVYSEFLAEITRQVKINEEKAIAELDEQVEVERKQAEAACDETELNRGKFASALEYVNNVLESCHEAEKLQQFNEIRSVLENLNIDQINERVEKTVFEIHPATITVQNLSVKIMKTMEGENISSNFFEKFASVVAVSSKSPDHMGGAALKKVGGLNPPLPRCGASPIDHVQCSTEKSGGAIALPAPYDVPPMDHRVTLQPAVKCVQLERRFSSLIKEDRECWLTEGWCEVLAVGDGVLVVTNSRSKNVNVFDKINLTFKLTLNQTQHQLQIPGDVTCNRLGEIFITDRGIHGVVKYDAAGRLMKVYPDVYKGHGYITCHVDQLIVADTQGGRVLYTDFECKVHHQIDAHSLGLSKFSPYYYICVDEKSGHLVVSQFRPPRVYLIDPTQPAVIHTFSDELCGPRGVCVDQFGYILLADTDWYFNHRIILLTPTRAHVITREGDVYRPMAICTSGPGQVYVLEAEGDVKEFKYLDI